MGMKKYGIVLVSMVLFLPHMHAARIDEAVYGGIRKGFFCLATAFAVTKTLAHSKMAQYSFNVDEASCTQQKKVDAGYAHVDDCWWRSWGTWGGIPLKEKMSYMQHGASSAVWFGVALCSLYGVLHG